MEKHVFVVFTNAVEGQENIYNEWYTDVHLKDVLKVDDLSTIPQAWCLYKDVRILDPRILMTFH